jgi:hypothetical protein
MVVRGQRGTEIDKGLLHCEGHRVVYRNSKRTSQGDRILVKNPAASGGLCKPLVFRPRD